MKFFKLGSKASVFYCSKCGLKVLPTTPGKLSDFQAATSKKVKIALANLHLVGITEEEYNQIISGTPVEKPTTKVDGDPAEGSGAPQFDKMTAKECEAYYADNFEVSAEELTEFKALKLEQKREYLTSLES